MAKILLMLAFLSTSVQAQSLTISWPKEKFFKTDKGSLIKDKLWLNVKIKNTSNSILSLKSWYCPTYPYKMSVDKDDHLHFGGCRKNYPRPIQLAPGKSIEERLLVYLSTAAKPGNINVEVERDLGNNSIKSNKIRLNITDDMITAAKAKPLPQEICNPNYQILQYVDSLPKSLFKVINDKTGEEIWGPHLKLYFKTFSNDYLVLKHEAVIPTVTFKLSRIKDKKPLISIFSDGVSVQNVFALHCENNSWKNLDVFPKVNAMLAEKLYKAAGIRSFKDGKSITTKALKNSAHSLLRYVAPKDGGEIYAIASHPNLKVSDQKKLFHLAWNGKKYVATSGKN